MRRPSSSVLTDGQRKKIFAEAGKAGFSNKDLHEYIKKTWSLDSIKSLTCDNAASLIDLLASLNNYTNKFLHKSPNENKISLETTPAQLCYIISLAEQIGWDIDHLNAWLLKYQKVNSLRDLKKGQAQKVIFILKNIVSAKKEKEK